MALDRKSMSANWRGAPRFFITARIAFMVFAPAPLLFGFAADATELQRALYISGLLFIEAGGALLLHRAWRGRPLSGPVLTALPAVDIAGLAVMELAASKAVPDPLYPVFLILPVLYALLVPKRQALAIGAVAGLAFAAAAATRQAWDYSAVLVYAERVVCLPLVTWLVALGGEQQRRQVERMQVVAGISEAVHTSLDAEFLTSDTVEVLADVLGLPSWQLYVLARQSRSILFEACIAHSGAVSISTSVPEWHSEVPSESSLGVFATDPAFEAVPILVEADAEVVLCAPPHDLHRLTPEDRIVLQAVARELLVAVENRRLYGVAMKLSLTDALTGLFNRRHLADRIAEEIGRARRYGQQVSLLMLDGDDFKHVNDEYGHRVGDEVLVQLAALMRSTVREVDVIARYGGEEFCVLLPETDAHGARQVAEKICSAVASHSFGPGVRITLSCGIATFPDHVDTAEDLQQVADSALYSAKSRGKNRVCVPMGRRAS